MCIEKFMLNIFSNIMQSKIKFLTIENSKMEMNFKLEKSIINGGRRAYIQSYRTYILFNIRQKN